jgi:hypothetical protein
MKKFKLVLIIFQFCSCLVTYSQFEYYKPDTTRNNHRAGELIVSASPNILLNTPKGVQFAGGLKFQVFLGKRISIDADVVFGRDYIHAGPGIFGLPLCLIASDSFFRNQEFSFGDGEGSLTDFFFSVAIIAMSFEHISYHIPLKYYVDISPYLSLLRYKYAYVYSNPSDTEARGEQFSFASGVQLNKYFGRFVLSPYAEYNIGYKDHISGCNIGVYCGIYFPYKKF